MCDNSKAERINWLSILRGITIFLVVMNHVRLLDLSTGNNYTFIENINEAFAPLRMPTFVMVSGALLYYTRINKGWDTLSLYRDKVIRIGMPLIFCTCLGNLMQMLFNSFVKTPHDITLTSFMQSFVVCDGMPWPHRWYLMVLLIMMALYPLYRLVRTKASAITVMLLLMAFQFMDFRHLCDTNWFYLFSLNKYLPFFFLGIAAFRFGWWRWLQRTYVTIALCMAYFICYILNIPDLTIVEDFFPLYELLGICTIVSLSIQTDRICPSLCSSYRNYIFQIYLFGIAFQAFVELILWRLCGYPSQYVFLFYILNILAGIYMPVLMCKVIERIPSRLLQNCVGLK